ncbi:pix-1 [Pristionchus pacificus]|uniref:Pix-1 n=1 Tax=Pristionchus pacificus TaxID=54126 RepID=A0A2A6BGD7_PRIPA|nr:pix-1 [Pristionchus pacificus]|eukprot:PDM64871.1 pix-1 [Pristionchus pacificus]
MDHGITTPDRKSFYARSQHAFCGKNNDELSFGIGDVIAITQQVEGGWWEGTLNGETGWFPSGYVTMIADKENLVRSRSIPNVADSPGVNGFNASDGNSTQKQFISQVLESFLKSEGEYILSLKNIIENYLAPLSRSNVVSQGEFNTIEGEISAIFALQANILVLITDMQSTDLSLQRIGGVLISSAPELKQRLTDYCANHPDAVDVIKHRRDELDGFFTSLDGNMRTFIQGLSEPFRHLKMYPPVLQELHRMMPESHADRGDLQRSVVVYRDLMELCEWVRRQREVQTDFLRTPRVSQFVRDEAPGQIFIVGGAMSNLSTRRMTARNAIVMKGIDEVTFEFPSSYDCDRWVDAMRKGKVPFEEEINGKASTPIPAGPPVAVTMRSRKKSMDESLDQMDAALAADSLQFARLRNKNSSHQMASTPTSSTSSTSLRKPKTPLDDTLPFRINHELEMIMPEGLDDDEREDGRGGGRRNESAFYMRHYPPFRSPSNMVDLGKRGVKMRKDPSSARDHGDATLLAIVEGYLNVGGEDNDRGGGSLKRADQPQLIVAEDEKLLIEETVDGQTVMTEKSLVDVVYALKDQMDRMVEEMASLRSQVEKEQRARRRLEDSIKRSSLQLSTSTPKPLLDTSN